MTKIIPIKSESTAKLLYLSPVEEKACCGEFPHAEMPLENLGQRIEVFHQRFNKYFITGTRNVIEQSKQYLLGLIQSRKRNMERMAEVVPGADNQVYQHFISCSPWDERPLLDQIASDVNQAIGDSEDCFLLLDETGIAKKGTKSVGVARQWNGRLGKVDNCQVVVFAALGCGMDVALINERLYLGKEWVDDPVRCNEAHIPEEARVFLTKSELALEMVQAARSQGLGFQWVGMDGGYGKDPWLMQALDRDGEIWVADVHRDQRIYLEDPQPIVPERTSSKGQAPSRLVAQTTAIRVDSWVAGQPETAWKEVALRESTKGTLFVEVLHRRVWLWDGEEPQAHCRHLIVRREIESPGEIKYTLSNAPDSISTERLAYMQGQRYWVEYAFREAKSEIGMAEYQLRGWQGFHHHMAMVMLTMLFFFQVRLEDREFLPLLSFHDIGEVLRVVLPRANVTHEVIMLQLKERHRRRQSSIDSAYRKQARKKHLRGP